MGYNEKPAIAVYHNSKHSFSIGKLFAVDLGVVYVVLFRHFDINLSEI